MLRFTSIESGASVLNQIGAVRGDVALCARRSSLEVDLPLNVHATVCAVQSLSATR